MEGNAAASVRVGQDGVEPGHAVRVAALRTQSVSHGGKGRAGVLQSGILGDPGRGQQLGMVGVLVGQGLGPQWDQGTTVEWHMKGGGHHCRTFPAHQPSFPQAVMGAHACPAASAG